MRKEEAKTETKAVVVPMAFLWSVFSVAAVAGQNEEAVNMWSDLEVENKGGEM